MSSSRRASSCAASISSAAAAEGDAVRADTAVDGRADAAELAMDVFAAGAEVDRVAGTAVRLGRPRVTQPSLRWSPGEMVRSTQRRL
jgi:hypothetical protein